MNNIPTVLIVEDEHTLREALHDKLKREGCIVFEARDGKEGLAIALKEHPSLILLDIVMPVMDGIAMLKALREDPRGKDIPVIMLTNLNGDDKVAEAVDLGSYEYFVKADHSLEDIIMSVKNKFSNNA